MKEEVKPVKHNETQTLGNDLKLEEDVTHMQIKFDEEKKKIVSDSEDTENMEEKVTHTENVKMVPMMGLRQASFHLQVRPPNKRRRRKI